MGKLPPVKDTSAKSAKRGFSNYKTEMIPDFKTFKIDGELLSDVLPPDVAAEIAFHQANPDMIKLSPRAAAALGKVKGSLKLRGAQSMIDLVDDARKRGGYESERFDWDMNNWHDETRRARSAVRDAKDKAYEDLELGKGAVFVLNNMDDSARSIVNEVAPKPKRSDYGSNKEWRGARRENSELRGDLFEAARDFYDRNYGGGDTSEELSRIGEEVRELPDELFKYFQLFETDEYPTHYSDESIRDKMDKLSRFDAENPDFFELATDLDKLTGANVFAPLNDYVNSRTGGVGGVDNSETSKAQSGKAASRTLRGDVADSLYRYYTEAGQAGSAQFDSALAGLEGISYLWAPFIDNSGIHKPLKYDADASLKGLEFLTGDSFNTDFFKRLYNLASERGDLSGIFKNGSVLNNSYLGKLSALERARTALLNELAAAKDAAKNNSQVAPNGPLPVTKSSSFVLDPYKDMSSETSLIGNWLNKNKSIFEFLSRARDVFDGLNPEDFPVLPFPVNLHSSYVQGLPKGEGYTDVDYRTYVDSVAEKLGVPSKFDSPRDAYNILISRLAQKYPFAFDPVTGGPLFRAQFTTHSNPIGILDAGNLKDAPTLDKIKNGDLPFNLYQSLAPTYRTQRYKGSASGGANAAGPQYDALAALRNLSFFDYPEGGTPGFNDRTHAILNDVVNLAQVLGGELGHGARRASYSDDPTVRAIGAEAGLDPLSEAFLKVKTIEDARAALESHMSRFNSFLDKSGISDRPRFGSPDGAFGADDYLNAIRDILSLSQIYRNINPALTL